MRCSLERINNLTWAWLALRSPPLLDLCFLLVQILWPIIMLLFSFDLFFLLLLVHFSPASTQFQIISLHVVILVWRSHCCLNWLPRKEKGMILVCSCPQKMGSDIDQTRNNYSKETKSQWTDKSLILSIFLLGLAVSRQWCEVLRSECFWVWSEIRNCQSVIRNSIGKPKTIEPSSKTIGNTFSICPLDKVTIVDLFDLSLFWFECVFGFSTTFPFFIMTLFFLLVDKERSDWCDICAKLR